MPGECPVCGGPGVLLGALGKLTHFRCRHCGMTFHTEEDDLSYYPENDNGRPED